MWCTRWWVGGCTGRSSLSGLVIGVLSVSCSSELLLNFSAPRNTSTPLLMRITSSPLTHDQHTVLLAPTHIDTRYMGTCSAWDKGHQIHIHLVSVCICTSDKL